MDEIKAAIRVARTHEPADDFQRFQVAYERGTVEDDVVNMLDILQGNSVALQSAHVIRQKKKMSNLKPLTTEYIPRGNPDRVYGSRSSELEMSHPRAIGRHDCTYS